MSLQGSDPVGEELGTGVAGLLGWNWVAHRAPFSTAATKGLPWVVQVTSGARIAGFSTWSVQSWTA